MALGQDPEPLSGRGPALLDLGSGGAMARQCAIVVQRCTQAREGEDEGGILGQLGEFKSSAALSFYQLKKCL